MRRRLDELRALRPGFASGDTQTLDRARSIAQSLRGSGATYGFPDLSELAALVESASDAQVHRRTEGLVEVVRALAMEVETGTGHVAAEWLGASAGEARSESSGDFESLASAWESAVERTGRPPAAIAADVASHFGLGIDRSAPPSRSALRLVPEVFVRTHAVLPVAEDSERLTVATSDPTALAVESELIALTGRAVDFLVVDPSTLGAMLADALGGEPASGLGTPTAPPPRHPTPAARPSEEHVLVVDDDAPWRLMARTVLEKGGYSVSEAADGEEALGVLEEDGGAALVVADLNMPKMDGLELLWALRQRREWSGIPVVVVTGETDEVLEANLMEEGADDYIRKPMDPRLFLARVAATIRRAEH